MNLHCQIVHFDLLLLLHDHDSSLNLIQQLNHTDVCKCLNYVDSSYWFACDRGCYHSLQTNDQHCRCINSVEKSDFLYKARLRINGNIVPNTFNRLI